MAKYTALTAKQMEMLEPLEREAKANRKKRDRLQKRLAFDHALGFEDNIEVHQEIEELDDEYKDYSTKIGEIYGAHDEMVRRMKLVLKEVTAIKAHAEKYGFDISI